MQGILHFDPKLEFNDSGLELCLQRLEVHAIPIDKVPEDKLHFSIYPVSDDEQPPVKAYVVKPYPVPDTDPGRAGIRSFSTKRLDTKMTPYGLRVQSEERRFYFRNSEN